MTNTNRIPNGTTVQLDDGTTALAYADVDGTYRTAQRNPVTGGTRVDLGWRREQLRALPGYPTPQL
jgi:hypothetical protein